MSSPHGSLFCSHWKCAAVVCEVYRIERFRCCWKTLLSKSSKWMLLSRALSLSFLYSILVTFSLYLLSFCPQSIYLFSRLFILLSHTLPSVFFSFCIFCLIGSLDRHVQSHHGHHKPFKCKLCPFKSAYVSRLKSHLHKAHTGKHTNIHTLNHILLLYPWLTRYSWAWVAASCLSSST